MTPRRDPISILTAHKMDPSRIELYVEGQSDRLFLLWIASDNINSNVIINDISYVEMNDSISGGQRERLHSFAQIVEGDPAKIIFFSDADFDRILSRLENIPSNVSLTDGRDLESYFLRHDCFEKITKIGISTDRFDGAELLRAIEDVGRTLGCIRLYSEINTLRLPFQNTNIIRHISFTPCSYTLDVWGVVSALVSNAGMSGKFISPIIGGVELLEKEHEETPSTELIHGKDLITLFSEVLRFHDLDRRSSEVILRTSFERNLIENYPSLSRIIDIISISSS